VWGGAIVFPHHQPSASLTMSHSTIAPLSPSTSMHPLPGGAPLSSSSSPTHSGLPTQTYHSTLLPRSIPMPALLDSVAAGAHYSGVESVNERRRSLNRGHSHTAHTLSPRRHSHLPAAASTSHLAAMDDIREVRGYHSFGRWCAWADVK
jgi:hypothetical protein